MRKLLNAKGGWIVAIGAIFGVFVALNTAISGLAGMRLDLTEDRLFTLADGTRRILDRIEEPVTLELYISQRLVKEVAIYGAYAGRVRDVLNEFSAAAGDRLNVIELDPEPFSETEDVAVAAGVQGVPIDSGGERVYFGLAARLGDTRASIGFFQPNRESFLEYDLARLIEGLINPKKKVIGVITSLPMFGDFAPTAGRSPRWLVVDAMEQGFEVRNIFDIETDLTDEIDVLFMAHATALSEPELYIVDQYLMRGGRALLMVDPYSELAQGALMSGRPLIRDSSLNKLMAKWGVSVIEKKVVGDMPLARTVNAGTAGAVKPAPYLLWPSFKGANINPTDAVTRDITTINLGTAGAIMVAEDAALTVDPLLVTTEKSQTFDAAMIDPRTSNILEFIEKFKAAGHQIIVAARLSGDVESAFVDGPPSAESNVDDVKTGEPAKPEAVQGEADETPAPPHLARSAEPLNIILIADTDMLEARFWVREQEFFGQRVAQPFANNGDMIINALENLAGSGALITLRSRGTAQRPFTRVDALRVAADEKFRAREQALVTRLQGAQVKFDDAQKKAQADNKDSGGAQGIVVLTTEQRQALEAELGAFRDDLLAIRKELRDVQLNLRKEIESLDSWLRFLNITLVPLLVVLFAITLGIVRRRKAAAA
jgi:ABC-type uncharacterized transport system involved in gliding motility auxiliary subunit